MKTTDIPNFMGMNSPSDAYKYHDSNQHLNCTYNFGVTEHRGENPTTNHNGSRTQYGICLMFSN